MSSPTPSPAKFDNLDEFNSHDFAPRSPPRLTPSRYGKRGPRLLFPKGSSFPKDGSPLKRLPAFDGAVPRGSRPVTPLTPFSPKIHDVFTDTESTSSCSADDDEWTTGDFELQSADGIRFFVPSCYVLASSPVFRDAHILNNGKHKIAFTDATYETAPVLRLWLQLVEQGTLPITKTLPDFKGLALFLLKWEMESCLNNLSAHLEVAVRRKLVGPTEAFIVSANAGDVVLCHLVLTVFWQDKWSGPVTRGLSSEGKIGQSVWDPRYWSAGFWEATPQRYLFAIARAYGDNHLTEGGIANGFKDYFELLGKEES